MNIINGNCGGSHVIPPEPCDWADWGQDTCLRCINGECKLPLGKIYRKLSILCPVANQKNSVRQGTNWYVRV